MSRIGFSFARVTRFAGLGLRTLGLSLRYYLCLTLLGCASTQPRPTVMQPRDIETLVLPADREVLFHACVGVLQNLGYTVELADADAGVLTASRETMEPTGAILEEGHPKKGMPGWGTAMLVMTGIAAAVLVVAAVRKDDEKDKAKDKSKDKKEDGDKHEAGDQPRYKDEGGQGQEPGCEPVANDEGQKRRYKGGNDGGQHADAGRHGSARHRPRHRGGCIPNFDPEPTTIIVQGDDPPPAPTTYRYRLTLNLTPVGETQMQVRASLQGTELKGGQVVKAGPVTDPDFFHDLFESIDRVLTPAEDIVAR